MANVQSKEDYRNYCNEAENISIFHQPWWLDIACQGMNWDVVLSYDKTKNIIGALPYLSEAKPGLRLSRMPALTPFIGPWIKPSKKEKRHARYSYEAKVMEDLVKQLPGSFYFFQKLSPSITNWYPFYLHGYDQSTAYTYILEGIKDLDAIWNGMKNTVRTTIRKCESMVSIQKGESVADLYNIQQEIFKRQKLAVPYTLKLLEELYQEAVSHNCCQLFYATDQNNQVYGGLMLVWDNQCAYNLVMGARESHKNSGVIQYLMWHAIQYAADHVDTFNFEGTMLPQVEPVFRHFGGKRTPYFRISKDKNRFSKALRILLGK
jgi:hypothetical protein